MTIGNQMKKLIESLVKIIEPQDEQGRKVFIRRPIRVKVSRTHKIKLLVNGKEIEIENINSTGLGLSTISFSDTPKPGEKLEAILEIDNVRFSIELVIVYTNNLVGCKINNISRDLINKIETYFQFEILGNSLTRIKSEILKQDPDGVPISFFGSEQFELNLVVDKLKVIKFNLTFFDKYIELGKDQSIKVGTIENLDQDAHLEYKKSNLIDFTKNTISEIDKININKILLNINSLDINHFNQIINIITRV